MSDARAAGVVVDTVVISWLFDDRPNTLAESYRELLLQLDGSCEDRGGDRSGVEAAPNQT